MTSEPMLQVKKDQGGGGIFGMFRKETSPPRTMTEIKMEMLEEGRLTYEDACTLDLVSKNKLPFDEYQELISDRRNYRGRTTKFAVQVALTTAISAFTMTMLALGKPEGVYLPVLTGLVGYWLPAPDTSHLRVSSSSKKPATRQVAESP